MPTGPDSRVAALDDLLDDAGLDALLATKDASIAYLTGFWGLQLERFFGVAVRRGGLGALIAPTLDRESVGVAPTGLERVLYPTGESNGLPEAGARSTAPGGSASRRTTSTSPARASWRRRASSWCRRRMW